MANIKLEAYRKRRGRKRSRRDGRPKLIGVVTYWEGLHIDLRTKRVLRSWKRRSPSPLLRRRATILLALRDGATYAEAARIAKTSIATVQKWRRRFLDARDTGGQEYPVTPLSVLALPDSRDRNKQITQARRLLARGETTRAVAMSTKLSQSMVARIKRDKATR